MISMTLDLPSGLSLLQVQRLVMVISIHILLEDNLLASLPLSGVHLLFHCWYLLSPKFLHSKTKNQRPLLTSKSLELLRQQSDRLSSSICTRKSFTFINSEPIQISTKVPQLTLWCLWDRFSSNMREMIKKRRSIIFRKRSKAHLLKCWILPLKRKCRSYQLKTRKWPQANNSCQDYKQVLKLNISPNMMPILSKN